MILLVSTVFSTIFYFGVNSSFSRLYHKNKNSTEKKSFYSTSYLLILIGFLIQIIIGYIFSKYLSFLIFEENLYNDLLFISIIGQGICFVNTLKMNYFRVNGNVIKFFIFSVLNFTLSLVLTYLQFKYFEISIWIPINTILIVNILLFLILLFISYQNLSFHSIKLPEIKRIFLFGFPFVLSSIFIMLGEWGDKVIISKFLSAAELADFSMVIKISSLYTLYRRFSIFL